MASIPIGLRKAAIAASLAIAAIAAIALGSNIGEIARDTAQAGPVQVVTERPAGYVGREACAACHPDQTRRWQDSHHAKSMQPAEGAAVLGRFDGAQLAVHGRTTTFFSRDGRPWVRTEGSDGTPQDFPIAYTFGVHPLQQYLVAFPDGRFQPLPLAWDARPAAQGGQRWYSLYPDEAIRPGDPPALDRKEPDLELHVRRLPFHRPAQGLRPGRR
ncbi:MAG: cytochrome c family protein [Magnetospirillum sp.]|nr:cytochrome c family protein [Magnetospirillum sp.]